MSLRWHLADTLHARGESLADLAARLPFLVDARWEAATPPEGLGLVELAAICEALGCQPGELLSYAPESPADQAAMNLANDLFYQSFLAHRASEQEED